MEILLIGLVVLSVIILWSILPQKIKARLPWVASFVQKVDIANFHQWVRTEIIPVVVEAIENEARSDKYKDSLDTLEAKVEKAYEKFKITLDTYYLGWVARSIEGFEEVVKVYIKAELQKAYKEYQAWKKDLSK